MYLTVTKSVVKSPASFWSLQNLYNIKLLFINTATLRDYSWTLEAIVLDIAYLGPKKQCLDLLTNKLTVDTDFGAQTQFEVQQI